MLRGADADVNADVTAQLQAKQKTLKNALTKQFL
jgi:hypothetical protein